jgi:Tol biopolymer transport system component
MKNPKVFVCFLLLIIITSSYVFSQNALHERLFYIPNQYILKGTDFSKKIKVENLGKNVNSKFQDYAPSITEDGRKLLFVSDRPNSNQRELSYEYDSIWVDENYLKHYTLRKPTSDNFGIPELDEDVRNVFLIVDIENLKIIIIVDYTKEDLLNTALKDYYFSKKKITPDAEYEFNYMEYNNFSYLENLSDINKYFIEILHQTKDGLFIETNIIQDSDNIRFSIKDNKTLITSEKRASHDFWAVDRKNRYKDFSMPAYNIDPLNPDKGINTSKNEGVASFSNSGKKLYFTACNKPNGYGDCDISVSIEKNGEWIEPIILDENVNSNVFDSQPSIAPDNSRLYFISNRKGPNSKGNNFSEEMDIWYCDYDHEKDSWKPARNLEELNTPKREFSPFIAADCKTLFFASEGHKPSFGGLDFYVSRYNDTLDKWSEPINLGSPINTDADDFLLTLPSYGDVIYFSSSRTDIGEHYGEYDIYAAYIPEIKEFWNNYKDEIKEISDLEIIPNPFSTNTSIKFKLLENGFLSISIHDIYGNLINQIESNELNADVHSYVWNGNNDQDVPVAYGIYYLSITFTKHNDTQNALYQLYFRK